MLTVLKCVFIFHAACINTDVSSPSNLTSNISLFSRERRAPGELGQPTCLSGTAKGSFCIDEHMRYEKSLATGDDFAITLMSNNVTKNQKSSVLSAGMKNMCEMGE